MRRLLFVLCLLVPSSAAAEIIDEASYGLWTAFAANDDGGEFWYCGLETVWPDGQALMLRFYPDDFAIQMTDPQWSLPDTDDLGSVILRFDNGVTYQGRASPSEPPPGGGPIDTAFIDLSGDRIQFLDEFMRQSSLHVELPNNAQWDVSLDGTYRSTMAVVACMDLYRNYASTNPSSAGDQRNPGQ